MAIEKTGILVDTSTSFTNPSRFEEAGKVSTISASNLTPNTRYYVKGYVIQDGTTIYSNNIQNFYTDDTNIDYFTLSNATNTTNYIELSSEGSVDPITLEYSKDGDNWTSWTYSSGSVLALSLESGEHISFRGNNQHFSQDVYRYTHIDVSASTGHEGTDKYYYFSSSGDIAASGNIMTLVDKSGRSTTIPSTACFARLFKGIGSHLLSAPDLPAVTLTIACYYQMFSGTSISSAPVLPATVMKNHAYSGMFSSCLNLLTPPALPASSLSRECYYDMFMGSGITSSPNLPALSVPICAYAGIFAACRNLTNVGSISATSVTGEGGMSGMFRGCTSLRTAPNINVTTINANSACFLLFDGCTSLETPPPTLGGQTITGNNAFSLAFQGCTSLRTAPVLPATQIGPAAYSSMFYGCTSLRTAPDLPATSIGIRCYQSMFENSGITSAPSILPAMILKANCYSSMFAGTNITKAPVLPAQDISVTSCYNNLFYGCSSLNEVKVYAQNWSTANTSNWLQNVSATGDFYNLGRTTIPTGVSGIPSGWTEYNSL